MSKDLTIVQYKNERVITTEQLAEIYGTEARRITENFNRNKRRFTEKVHFYCLTGESLKEFLHSADSVVQNPSKVRQLYLWTERGADRHCKILDTDMAWKQFDNLEETYFKVKEQVKPLTPQRELKLHYEVLMEHDEEIKLIKKDIVDIKENSTLSAVECKELQDVVRKTGTRALGGHGTPAYNDRSLRTKLYADIQFQLKREFGVRRYEAIRRCKFEKAKNIISSYKAPTVLQEQITLKNNQIGF